MKRILLSTVFALVAVVSWAYDVKIDGIYYNLVSKAKTAEVTNADAEYTGDIVIPSSIDFEGVTYSVTSIGERAFSICSSLTFITIPNSVTSIGNSAFFGCYSLTSITIPNSVTSIGDDAFYNCSSLTSITIPNSVTSIGNYAFYNCSSLTSIIIPNSVTSIGSGAFSFCSNIETVTCYATMVPSMGSDVFENAYIEYSTLIVPEEALEAYRSTEPWSAFGTFKTIEGETNSVMAINADATPLLVSQRGGVLNIQGIEAGGAITAYTTDGRQVASVKADGNGATMDLSTMKGNVVVLNVNGKSAKVLVK